MKALKGRNGILTGASGGIGVYLAHALAQEGMNLFLVASPGEGLAKLSEEITQYGIKATAACLDLRRREDRETVITRAVREFGQISLLVNNAGVEFNGRFDQLSETQVSDVLSVNLEAPMMLTRLLLPHLLEHEEGHIVNISSLAGKSGPAFQESYAASKAGLMAFTCSLRGSYAGTGVSASVVCPGFVEAGIYTRLVERTGCPAPALLGACPPQDVARAVLRVVRKDLPEIIVNRYPVRPLLALSALCPSLGAWLTTKIGVHDFFRKAITGAPPVAPAATTELATPTLAASSKIPARPER